MNFTMIYLNDYKPSEEAVCRSLSIATLRLALEDVLAGRLSKPPSIPSLVLFRGPRVTLELYGNLCRVMQARGFAPLTSARSFRIAEDFSLHYPMLREWSPAAIVVDASVEAEELTERLAAGPLRFPVFVRSDLESAAKYVGLEGCVVSSPDLEELRTVLNNLRNHVSGFRRIILKEMRPIRRIGGSTVECRAVGLQGQLVHLDHSGGINSEPGPEARGLESFARKCLKALQEGGADGAVLLDVAVLEDDVPIVVECKDFLNGSLYHPEQVGSALVKHA